MSQQPPQQIWHKPETAIPSLRHELGIMFGFIGQIFVHLSPYELLPCPFNLAKSIEVTLELVSHPLTLHSAHAHHLAPLLLRMAACKPHLDEKGKGKS